ncbi:uncharacterized protein [Periplaneta americana]|uniref:uncharacterized protein n=1 Tax=Periplaneta americana TaxID=6978 RepID=UPI0037E7E374
MIFTLKGCCCFTLKTGCIVIGCFSGVRALLIVALSSYFAYVGHRNATETEAEENVRLCVGVQVTSAVIAVLSGIELVVVVFFLKGVLDSKPKLMLPWMVLCIADLIFSCLLLVSVIVLINFYETNTEFIWTLSIEPLNIGVNSYFHLVAHSYYKQLRAVSPIVSTSRQSSVLSTKLDPAQRITPLTEYLLQVPSLSPYKKMPTAAGAIPGSEHFGSVVSCNHPDT